MDWATLRRRFERGVRGPRPSAPHQPGVLANSPVTSSSLSTSGRGATRFIILCAARTGSTMLRHMLNSHPDVRCHGEVMTGRSFDALSGGDRDPDPSVTRALVDRRERDPQG